MAQKRLFLRHRRSIRLHPSKNPRSNLYRSSSGSSNSDMTEYPERPNDVSDWVRRRLSGARPAPKPVPEEDLPEVFELYGSGVPDDVLVEEEEDEALVQAVERSRQQLTNLQEMPMGNEEDMLQRAIELSLVDQ